MKYEDKTKTQLIQDIKTFNGFFDNFPALIDAYNIAENKFKLWNKECEIVTGYSAAEIIDNIQAFELLYPDAEYRDYMIKKLLNDGYNYKNWELELTCKDGTKKSILWSSLATHVPFYNCDILAVGVNITERKKLEEELLKARKLESLGVLAGGIAHDFNNILTAILGNLNLVQLGMDIKDANYDKLRKAETATIRARELTHRLVTFSSGGLPIKTTSSIKDLIMESSELALSGSNVKVRFDVANDLYNVDMDKSQIGQVINNLVLNSVQAMPCGGVIEIVARNLNQKKKAIPNIESEKYIEIAVSDQGIGIPENIFHQIFDPYFTTKQKGSGLGLTTSHSIVKNHHGHLAVESKPNEGTTFFIYLPASPKNVEDLAFPAQKTRQGQGHILVMDDDDMVRDTLAEMLKSLGYSVTCVSSGHQAVQVCKSYYEKGEKFNGAIIDLTIPGELGGKETIERLFEIDSKIKAIVSSGYSDDPVMSNFLKHGFKAVLKKPYKIEELSKTLHRVLLS